MTTTKSAVTVDHQARALLSLIAGWNPHGSEHDTSNAMDVAREMLAHPLAFDETLESPSVIEAIRAMLRAQDAENDPDPRFVRLLDAIEAGDDLPADIDAEAIGDLVFQSITYAAVLGGALMYQLLKGGAR